MATRRAVKKAASKAAKAAETKVTETKEAPKAIATKKDTTKAIETKAAVLVKETPVEKPAEKKTLVKRAAKKQAAKKAEMKVEMFLQFSGREYTEKEIFQKVKDVWTKTLRNKVGDMKSVQIYLKPEEFAAYYVINGETTGKIDL